MTTLELRSPQNYLSYGLRAFLTLLFIYIFIANSWLGDDSYITFRTVRNFVDGDGLRWNLAERVAVNVHPLWMLLMSAVHFTTREVYFSCLVLSFTLSLLALHLAWARLTNPLSILLAALLFFSSKGFIDYSSSGLETPLSYALTALFFTQLLYRRNAHVDEHDVLRYSLIAALGFLSRFDTILLFSAALCYLVCAHHARYGRFAASQILLGFGPAFLWLAFSLVYYGFIFPNVYYAKLNTFLTWKDRLDQGLDYFRYSVEHDPITPAVVAAALFFGLLSRDVRERMAAAGIALYLAYVLEIGGTFMTGRFLAVPFLISILIMMRRIDSWHRTVGVLCLVVGFYSAVAPLTPVKSARDYGEVCKPGIVPEYRVADDRCFYHEVSNLLFYIRGESPGSDHLSVRGMSRGGLAAKDVRVAGRMGYLGYFARPEQFIIDRFALTDPLLARIPGRQTWLIGHNLRFVPAGYASSQKEGRNLIEDPGLRQYYEKILSITRGRLFTRQRWRHIVELNVGRDRYYRQSDGSERGQDAD